MAKNQEQSKKTTPIKKEQQANNPQFANRKFQATWSSFKKVYARPR